MQDVKEGMVPTAELQHLIRDEVTRQIGETRQALEQSIAEVRARTVDDRATLVVFSGDLDKAMAAMVIATGAAAAGLETSLFFTFWGLSILKKKGAAKRRDRSAARTTLGGEFPTLALSIREVGS
jgi:hypothetical protein